MASVRIEKLCKTFDEKTNVVDDVSVCIRDNEFVVIVGPSKKQHMHLVVMQLLA